MGCGLNASVNVFTLLDKLRLYSVIIIIISFLFLEGELLVVQVVL